MKKVNPYHVLNLTPSEDFPCLSLYSATERDLASLMGKAEELGLKRYDARTMDLLLRPIHRFLKWEAHDSKNYPLALFVTKGFVGYSRLPFPTKPLAVVSNSFHVKPLLKWMQREHPFALLKLQEKEAVLYQGSLSYFEEIEILPYRELKTLDGVFNALDRAVYRTIQSSRVPLLLAGDFEMIETYKNVSGYKAIVDDAILDPNDYAESLRLHSAAIQVLEPFLEQKEEALLRSYWSAEQSGKTSDVLHDIVELALQGRVKHLFVNEKMNVWGSIDRENGSFTYSPQQEGPEDDVLDDLAEIVWKNHGMVTVLPSGKMPNGKAACSILINELRSPRRNQDLHTPADRDWQNQIAI
jgi:hypothetical protein